MLYSQNIGTATGLETQASVYTPQDRPFRNSSKSASDMASKLRVCDCSEFDDDDEEEEDFDIWVAQGDARSLLSTVLEGLLSP